MSTSLLTRETAEESCHLELDVLRCPDCQGALSLLEGALSCAQHARVFGVDGRQLNLLPSCLHPESAAEDAVFAPEGRELIRNDGQLWRFIVGRLDINRFADEILPLFRPGRFLELGGETSYAAAIFKAKYPDQPVYASDVSPNTMRQLAARVAPFFGALPDYFAALDAEHLPFADGTLDGIFGQSMLHHLAAPEAALRESYRTLKPGGTAIFVDHCVPAHWRGLFASVAHARSGEYGIREDLHSLANWYRILRAAGLLRSSLTFFRSPRYILNPWFVLAGRIIERLPLRLVLPLFPVGIVLRITKPSL